MSTKTKLPHLVPLLGPRERKLHLVLVVLWLAATLWFWSWWLQPEHIEYWPRYLVVSALIGWITFLQGFFIVFYLRAVRSSAPVPRIGQFRVAMIVTKTPSEPFSILRRTLEAMLAQDYPHDTWIADEDPSPETIEWCRDHGVQISTRKGVQAYHQKTWPRRTRCKEGNLAFFYDRWGYDLYDVVSQLDCDHVPSPGYLTEMLRPFVDDDVGYVSAPSICASNGPQNWAARTRLHTEGGFHGILQAGYSNGFAPMCIGSHYAVRTGALRSVGGLGPELAEDHSTAMLLNSGGWRGVHAVDAIAIGDGPATVADMVTQEFQWSRSLVTLLLQYTPRYLRQLTPRLRAQFLFCQLLYPILAFTYLAMYLIPIVAVVFDIQYAQVTYPAYLGHALPGIFAMLLIAVALSRGGHFRPTDASVLSWERILFIALQWPWVLWGTLMALRDALTGSFVDFRITPKGEAAKARLPVKVLSIYGALALGCILPVLLNLQLEQAKGFFLLTLLSGLLYVAVLLVTVWHHLSENGWRFAGTWRDGIFQAGLVGSVLVALSFALVEKSAESVYALSIGLEPVRLVAVRSRVAGAGSGPAGIIDYNFVFTWRD